MLAFEHRAGELPARFQELSLIWCILAPLRAPPFPGAHGGGGTSAGLPASRSHCAVSDLYKTRGSGGAGNQGAGEVPREDASKTGKE